MLKFKLEVITKDKSISVDWRKEISYLLEDVAKDLPKFEDKMFTNARGGLVMHQGIYNDEGVLMGKISCEKF